MRLSKGSCIHRFRPAFCIKSSFFQENRHILRIVLLVAPFASSRNHECHEGKEEIKKSSVLSRKTKTLNV